MNKRFLLYLLSVAGLGLVFIYLSQQPVVIVGDGGEYYSLFFAWTETFRPWMTSSAFARFQELIDSPHVTYWASLQQLIDAFPGLRLGETADFNHFWFYSFLAFLIAWPLNIMGLDLPVHHSFLLLHYVLLLLMFVVFIRLYGTKGWVAAFIMCFLSPMLWYFDKVHTELFTFVLSMLAVAIIHRRFYLAGAFCLAMAATQNPSFALVAFIPFCYRILLKRKEPLTLIELGLTLATALLVLLHPTYYFFRYGAPTPQLFIAGADLGGNLSTFYIWLFDPDVGLLPFWPVGILLVCLASYFIYVKKPRPKIFDWDFGFQVFFISAFLAINLYAHASTTNLNSGASAGASRYAMWYLPLFLPLLLYVLSNLKGYRNVAVVSIVFLFLNALYTFNVSWPSRTETIAQPSALSTFIQSRFSRLYTPPVEIFIEKFGGYGESIELDNLRAIVGPDCAKMLVFPGSYRTRVLAPAECFFDLNKLLGVINTSTTDNPETKLFYTWLNKQQQAASKLVLIPGNYPVGAGKYGNFSLRSGWSSVENTGVWSDGSISLLTLPCNAEQFYYKQQKLRLNVNLSPFGVQPLVVKYQQITLYEGEITATTSLDFDLDIDQCRNDSINLEFHLLASRSPFEMGMSADKRKLGVWLSSFSLY